MLSRRNHLLLTLSIIFLSSPILSDSPPTCDATITLECQNRLLVEAEKFTTAYRQCLLHQLKNSEIKIWNFLSSAIRSCLAREKFSESINVTEIGSREADDLSKFVILPSIDSPCVAVIARGKESDGEGSAEQELVCLMPHCELHVADLDPNAKVSNGKIYNKIISFRESGDVTWNKYADEHKLPREHPSYNPNGVTLKNFLEKHVKTPQIDYLWIDRVSPIWVMSPAGKPVVLPPSSLHGHTIFEGSMDVTICQVTLTTELFCDYEGVDASKDARVLFEDITPLFINISPILPIHSDFSKITRLLRTSYLNMASPYCLKKFLALVYCGNEACLEDQKFEESKNIGNEWKQFQENLKKFENDRRLKLNLRR